MTTPRSAPSLNQCYRLLDSLRRGLGNPNLSDEDYERIAEGLSPLDDLAWKDGPHG